MNKSLLLLISFLALFGISANNARAQNISKRQYVKEIKKERIAKNKEFRDTGQSPLANEQIADFTGLRYFRPNPDYKVKATFHKIEAPLVFKMKTTTEREPEYSTFGTISFKLFDTLLVLQVYQNLELIKRPGYSNYLFLPFTDETSARECYGGGRYIDLQIPESDIIEVDFNKAYNPYCAYNHKYSCPIPPAENHIPFKVRAGEKKYN
jgi:uncharacterized protein